MNLFVNYYISEKRQAELDFCLQKNIDNPQVRQIFVLCDRYIHFDDQKVKVMQLSYRPTIQDFMDLTYASDGINIIANADIYFDETLELAKNIKENEVYALARWDVTEDGIKHFDSRDSQDAWIINGHLNVKDCDFTQGIAGVDNAFAERLAWAGYKVSNPSKDIRAIHLHKDNPALWRNGEKAPKPYLLINPHFINDEPVVHRYI